MYYQPKTKNLLTSYIIELKNDKDKELVQLNWGEIAG